MLRLKPSDYIAVISDFDDTILDNGSDPEGNGLHPRSRYDGLQLVAQKINDPRLAAVPRGLNNNAIFFAEEHTAESAYRWLLKETGILTATTTMDEELALITLLMSAKNESYERLLETEAREIPGALAFFSNMYATGFANRLAIASSGRGKDIRAFFNNHGFSELFPDNLIIAKEHVTRTKPHTEVFEKALQALGIPKNQSHRVLVFEDDPRGIQPAREMGMVVCAVTTRFNREELLTLPNPPHHVAKDFTEYNKAFGFQDAG